MTVSEEFISVEEGQEGAGSSYPTAFGITFTPAITGAIIAVVGLAGSVYLLLNQVMPVWQKYQELQATSNDKQAQVQRKQAVLKQTAQVKDELAQAKKQKAEVLTLFANEKTLDTLPLDINRLVEASNAQPKKNDSKAKLKRYAPENQTAEVIADGSLGSGVDGKLKSRVVKVEFQGTFEQTQSVLRNIERLQPLLIVKEYQSTLNKEISNEKDVAVLRPASIATSFKLQALIPAEGAGSGEQEIGSGDKGAPEQEIGSRK